MWPNPIDRSGFALGTLAPRKGMKGQAPKPRKRSLLTHADMPMSHTMHRSDKKHAKMDHAKDKDGKDHAKMNHAKDKDGKDHAKMNSR